MQRQKKRKILKCYQTPSQETTKKADLDANTYVTKRSENADAEQRKWDGTRCDEMKEEGERGG